MAGEKDKWEVYQDRKKQYRWRRKASNGNIVGSATESYEKEKVTTDLPPDVAVVTLSSLQQGKGGRGLLAALRLSRFPCSPRPSSQAGHGPAPPNLGVVVPVGGPTARVAPTT